MQTKAKPLQLDYQSIYGIIAEYNPFHLGHQEQIRICREELEADLVIVIMSGHFLQRGIPAIVDKWTRAKMAVDGGADLVIELPVRFSLASSDDFAEGASKLLSLIGVNKLCFGTEKETFLELNEFAEIVQNNPNYDRIIYQYIADGYSYVKANELALTYIMKREVKIPPNALLALSYIKALTKYDLKMETVPIIRQGASFHDLNIESKNPSAEAIRMSLHNHLIDWQGLKKALPDYSYNELYKNHRYLFADDFYKQLVSTIFLLGKSGLKDVKGVKEGLENRFYEAVLKTKNYDELLDFLTSKRYTASTIRRIFFSALLGIKKDIDFADMPELKYHRILAMNKKGRKYISSFRKNPDLKPIVNFARDIKRFNLSEDDFLYDIKATGIYATECESIKANEDYLRKPYIKE